MPIDQAEITTDKVCDCEHCIGGRLVHWWCDGCGAGPFRFSHADPAGTPVKSPFGQRQYNNSKGLVAGIRRWCSAVCATAEEKIYLIDLLEKAQGRHDMTIVRVVTGRLHELAQEQLPQIPNVTEKMQRAPSLVAAPVADDTDETLTE